MLSKHENAPPAARDVIGGTPLFGLFNKLALSAREADSFAVELIAPRRGAGVSAIARALARCAAANMDGPVLLVRADPAATGPAGTSSLAELHHRGADLREAARPDGEDGLWHALLMQAAPGKTPAPLPLGVLDKIVTRLRASYRWIVFDSVPPQDSSFGLILSRFMNGTVVVAEAERTRLPSARQLVLQIRANGGTPIGFVVNKRRKVIPDFIYRFL